MSCILRTSLRRLIRQRLFTLINIAGLVTGITTAIFMLYYVRFEKNYDRFNRRYDDIYRVRLERVSETGETVNFSSTAPPVGLRIRSQFPEAEVVARALRYKGTFSFDDIAFYEEKIFFAEPELLQIFDFDVLSGSPSEDLKEQGKLFITRSMASKYFGSSDPLGRVLKLDGTWNFTIAGIMEDAPDDSHLRFDFLASWPDVKIIYGPDFEEAWGHTGVFTYVIFSPGTRIQSTEVKLARLVDDEFGEALRYYKLTMTLPLQPLSEIHLGPGYMQEPETNGDPNLVTAMLAIAIFIIIIAWVNYTVLSTAEITSRMAETGIRKILGAERRVIISELLTGTMILNIIAVILSVALIILLTPLISNLTGITYRGILGDSFIDGCLLVIFTGGIVIAGFYPAVLISSVKTSSALKGKQSASAINQLVRKVLVVVQNGISLMIISSTVVVWMQYSHLRKADTGVNLDNIITVKAPRIRGENYGSSLNAFISELRKENDITTTAMATEVPGRQLYWDAGGIFRYGSDQSKNYQIIGVDYNYSDLYEIKFLAGRNFSTEFQSDSMALILNRRATSWMGFESPEQAIDQKVDYWGEIFHIIGVVEDFRQRSVRYEPEPTLIRFLPEGRNLMGNIVIKHQSDNRQDLINRVKELYMRLFPGNSFEYFFADEYYSEQFAGEKSLVILFTVFSLISIMITILGVIGLTTYIQDQEKQVISIRKVLGGTAPGIVWLFTGKALLLVIISSLAAIPSSWILISKWLVTFADHVSLNPFVFLTPVLFILLLTALTVIIIVYRESIANPVKNLRYE
jgi:putative ABC transport system permease protein